MKKIGRYEIVEELGRGATGVVYKAADPTLSRMVAIKVLTLDTPEKEGTLGGPDLFLREARAAGRLSHSGIVTIHDAATDSETKLSYIVMEFIPGQTLENLLVAQTEGPPGGPLAPLPLDRALDLAAQIGESLDYAHRHDIIHRDLKPANILVTREGRAKIADFGIAKIVARDAAMRTAVMMGTPSFMSPEQVTGTEVDARSDLFSLGIILYLMLTGQRPFSGEPTAVMFKIAYQDPAMPSQINSQLGPSHDYLTLRCLVKDRTQRYSSAREFLDDLDDVRNGRRPRSEAKVPLAALHTADRTGSFSIQALTPPSVNPAVSEVRSGTPVGTGTLSAVQATATSRNPTPGRSSAMPPVLIGGIFIAVLALAGTWIWHRRIAAPAVSQSIAGAGAATASASPASIGTAGHRTASPTASPPATPPVRPPDPQASTPDAEDAGAAHEGTSTASNTAPSATIKATSSRNFQLVCKHNLDEGVLTISSGSQILVSEKLKGKKKGAGGFLGRRSGQLESSIRVPAEAKELAIQISLENGTVQLKRKIAALPPAANMSVLAVEVHGKSLKVGWRTGPASQ